MVTTAPDAESSHTLADNIDELWRLPRKGFKGSQGLFTQPRPRSFCHFGSSIRFRYFWTRRNALLVSL